jgi:Tol biopolymer transport system component
LLALLLVSDVAAGLLASVAIHPAEAAFPGANGKIVFASNRTSGKGVNNPEGDYELFAMKPDGNGLEQLTFDTANEVESAWSADGQLLAYVIYLDGEAEIFLRNYRFVLPVTRRLTTNAVFDAEPTFSLDGTRIAFSTNRDNNLEIYVMDTADNDHDGNGDTLTRLTTNTAFDSDPAWSPDGAKIAFVSDRDGGNSEVFVMDADGSDPVNLTNDPAPDSQPTWSPDGTKIAFTSHRDGNLEIYMMNADGSELKRLTKKAAHDFTPAWSPDGTKIAFGSNRGGGEEIYVMKAKPESKKNRPRNRTTNGVADVEPDWRPIP